MQALTEDPMTANGEMNLEWYLHWVAWGHWILLMENYLQQVIKCRRTAPMDYVKDVPLYDT